MHASTSLLSRRKQHEFKIPISEILFTRIPRVAAKPIELDPNPRDPREKRNYEIHWRGKEEWEIRGNEFAESNGIWCSASYHFELKFRALITHLSIIICHVMKSPSYYVDAFLPKCKQISLRWYSFIVIIDLASMFLIIYFLRDIDKWLIFFPVVNHNLRNEYVI